MSAPDAEDAKSSRSTESTEELVASRARIQTTADESRRRLQRTIHDGAQQRLVHALIVLKLGGGALDTASPAAALVQEALTNVEQAARELRQVVHAILPSSLVHGGLRTGLQSLADDLPVRVGLRVGSPRLSPEVETTAYLVVAEAVDAVVAQARVDLAVDLDVDLQGDTLVLEIRHDATDAGPTNSGPTEPGGSGTEAPLTGVRDRVRAAGGTLTVRSLPGGRTALRAALPVHPDAETAREAGTWGA